MGLEENYQELAIAIIKQAARDWQQAAKRLRKNSRNKEAARVKEETERFFRSEYCYGLGGVDGRAILRKLQEVQ